MENEHTYSIYRKIASGRENHPTLAMTDLCLCTQALLAKHCIEGNEVK